ncbi:MAG: MATE family efflux transporter [Thermomicrobiales bacterium]|nr:MATE family efflux transporter [Thermomicrobiales bacterium]
MSRRRVLGMALPIIGENLLHTSVVAVDTLMVSRLGTEEVAGVGTAAEMVWFLISMLIALDIGATVLVAQAIGAGEGRLANTLARQAIVWGLLLAVPISISGYVASGPVVGLFGTEPEVAEHATTFLHITTATSIFLLLTFVSGAILRGAGDSRTPLYAAIVANVVNVGVSWVLIFGHLGLPELGVAGSAWGAASARAVSAIILVTLLARGTRRISIRGRAGWKPDLDTGRSIFRLGIPAAVQEMLSSAGFMTMLAVVATLGTASLAAQQIGFTALSLAFMPGFAFGIASTALVGQSIGARRPDDARKAVRISVQWSILWMAVGGGIYFIFANPVMRLFTDDPEVVTAGANALRALAIGLPFWSVWFVFGGALRGIGDTRTPMISSGVAVWGAVGIAYLMVTVFDRGLGTVWLSFLITAPVAAFVNWTIFRRRMAAGVSARVITSAVPLH